MPSDERTIHLDLGEDDDLVEGLEINQSVEVRVRGTIKSLEAAREFDDFTSSSGAVILVESLKVSEREPDPAVEVFSDEDEDDD